MAIRISRNANGNAINFIGTSQPTYWNACLSGEVNSDDSTKVNVVNDIQTTDTDNPVYEFFAIPYTDFTDEDGNGFATAQAAADYITEKANVVAGGTLEFSATDTLDASRDATNTNILFSTGNSYGVNSIRAIAQSDGNITIEENVQDGTALFTDLRPANTTIEGDAPNSITVNAVVNALNALFTVSPLGLGDIDPQAAITTTQAQLLATDFTAFGDVTLGGTTFTKGTNTGSQVDDGLYSDDIINEAGDYFEFDVASSQGNNDLFGGAFVMGFKDGSLPVSEITGNTANMGDLDLALRFRGMNSAEEHDYGIIIEPGFYNNPKSKNKFRMGLDADRRLFISFYESNLNEWQVAVRSAFPTVDEEYRVVFFLKRENAFLPINATQHTVTPNTPTLYHRYIESPDGDFHYPLFATQEEAEHKDTLNGGSGQHAQYSFADEDPSVNVWYGPATGYIAGTATSAPTDPNFTYTVIPTLADANFVPAAFTFSDVTVDENASVNISLPVPAGASFTQEVFNIPSTMTYNSVTHRLEGTAPDVPNTIAQNPSDVYTITVRRTNTFGSTNTTFDLTVTNLSNPVTAITGLTHIATSTALVDSDTLDNGSVVELDDATDDGNRTIFSASWLNTNVWGQLANAHAAGDHNSTRIWIGFTDASANWANGIDDFDFDEGLYFALGSSSEKFVSPIGNGSLGSGVNWGNGAWTNDAVFYNMTSTNAGGRVHAGIANPANSATSNPTSTGTVKAAGDYKIAIAYVTGGSVNMDIALTGITETSNAVTNATSWSKALDFSGGNEYAYASQTNTNYQPIAQPTGVTIAEHANGPGTTSNAAGAKPWACAVSFNVDGHSSNQHIWNMGEGAGSSDDNIWMRMDSLRNLYFGWGRSGALNEVYIGSATPGQWNHFYVGYNGTRLSGSNATAANLANVFDIRRYDGPNDVMGSNLAATTSNWTTTGGRMDRTVTGNLTIGGRGTNRNFHGKVAAMTVTTLEQGVAMPTTAEIKKMVTDPKGWVADYKVGGWYRSPANDASSYGFQINSYSKDWATQVWLMGDGASDSYPTIANYVRPSSNHAAMVMSGMVSNDIQNVTLPYLP